MKVRVIYNKVIRIAISNRKEILTSATSKDYMYIFIYNFQSDSGPLIIQHVGRMVLITDLKAIQQNKIKKDHQSPIEKIIQFLISSEDAHNIVPPLISDLPLSYRSDQTDNISSARTGINDLGNKFSASCKVSQSQRDVPSFRSKIGTTASTISGIEHKSASVSGLQTGCVNNL